MSNTTVKIFIASSSELQVERKQCVLLINQIGESYSHLTLKPVEWEYSLVHGNYPGQTTVQSAINPQLQTCDLVIFIFHSKIGQYTREEFEFATANNIRLFVFFKQGFSPKKDQLLTYSELLEFKESLNETVLYKEYETLDSFEKQLFANLSLYLSQTYPVTVAPSQDVSTLIKLLTDKEQEIKKLKDNPHDESINIKELTGQIDAIRTELQQSKELIEKQAKDREALEQKLMSQKDDDALKAEALEALKQGNYEKAEENLVTVANAAIDKTISTLMELADIKALQLEYADALYYIELAVSFNSENTDALYEAGFMADTLGNYDKAIEYYQKGIGVEIKMADEENELVAEGYCRLSWSFYNKQEFDKSIEYANKAIETFSKFFEEDDAAFSSAYHNLNAAYSEKGEYDTAIEYGFKALAINRKLYGEESLDVAGTYSNLCLTYNSKGDCEKGIEYGTKALNIFRKHYDEEHPDMGLAYNNVGECYLEKGEVDKAINYFEKSLDIKNIFLPAGHPHIERTTKNLTKARAQKMLI